MNDAAPTNCGVCGQPIVDEYYGVANRIVCPQCAEQVRALTRRNDFESGAIARGLALGLPAALIGGAVWGTIEKFTGYRVGIIALGIGWLISVAIAHATGGRRGRSMQVLGGALAIVGILMGRYFTLFLYGLDQNLSFIAAAFASAAVLVLEPHHVFSAFDLLWIFIAVMVPVRSFKPIRIDLRGPQHLRQSAPDVLRFDRVEPAIASPPQPPIAPPEQS